MPLIDLLRHGVTDRPGDLVGRTDAALCEEGWTQLERQTAGRSWGVIVASPLRRAREPAERLGAERGIAVEIDPDWRELDLGDWDGRPIADLRADAATAELLSKFYRDPETAAPPNGETFGALRIRVARALKRLADRSETVLVIAHGGPIRTALSLATGIPMASVWSLRIEPATRVRVSLGRHPEHGAWGEIIEIAQP